MNLRSLFLRGGLTLALAACLPGLSSAQERGTITGTVTDVASGQPLSGAQIVIEGTNYGGLSNQSGRYLIPNVPAGEHRVRAILIGYGPEVQDVMVTAGETSVADFRLALSAISLDQLVVTATGVQRKRELGNAVGTIQADEIVDVAPINNISDLIKGRSAGVQVLGSSGTPGMGSRIRIRGSSSISLSNEPLIYVDGVRVSNDDSFAGNIYTGGQEPSRIDDINPEDIESVEIVKGPAAATLYGTEAANGVIRITTKRGRPGETRWSFWAETGVVQEKNNYPLNYGGYDAAGKRCLLDDVARGRCVQSEIKSYQVLYDPELSPFKDGSRKQYGMSLTGGSERVNFYVSAEIEGEEGPYKLPDTYRQVLLDRGIAIKETTDRPQQLDRANIRVNLNAQTSENSTMALRVGYLTSNMSFTGNDNNSFGFLPSAFFGGNDPNNPDRAWGFQTPAELFGRDLYQDVERLTTSLSGTWEPLEWLSTRASFGLDYTNRHDISFYPRDIGVPGQSNLGRKDSSYRNLFQYTFDAGGIASFDLTNEITSKTAVGVQYFRSFVTGTNAWGIDIVNGAASIGAAAETFSSETTTEDKTAGLFVDQTFGWRDRLFVTGAIRADDNSAFGQDFDLIYYPKASVSWILSEEEFFPELSWLNEFRFRGAWGRSGLQPGSTAAIRTLAANAITDPNDNTISGVSIGSIGNVDLKPERSSEIELGFDADLLGGRAGIEFTYYKKTTEDALITVPLAPSLGASNSRWVNIGKVENKGLEVAITATVLDTDKFDWDLTLSGSDNQNELITLGEGTEPIGSQIRHVPGYPLGGWWAKPIQSYSDANGDGLIGRDEVTVGDTLEFIGPSMPEKEASLSTTFTLLDRLSLYAQFDYRGDYYAYNNTERFRCRFRLCRALIDPTTPQWDQARAVASLFHPSQTVVGYMEDAAFIKLREVAVTYNFSQNVADLLRVRRASVTIKGRNLKTWTDYSGMDPEINWSGSSSNFGVTE
ncbi:MAG: SusC/RagA family TonB-linked outer membrane protein, partial [Gemmatimonadota bacterium]